MDDHSVSYDFVKLGNELADTLMRAAEEQVTKAQLMMDQTKSLVEIIRNQVMAQAKSSEDMNARFKQVGSIMLDAHRILNGDIAANFGSMHGAGLVSQAPSPDLARLRALDDLKRGRDVPAGSSTFSPNPAPDAAKRDPAASYPARQAGGLPHALADLDRFRVNRADPGADHRDPGTGTKQPNRD